MLHLIVKRTIRFFNSEFDVVVIWKCDYCKSSNVLMHSSLNVTTLGATPDTTKHIFRGVGVFAGVEPGLSEALPTNFISLYENYFHLENCPKIY